MFNNNFVYYKNLSEDEIILNEQLEVAKAYYDKIDEGCKNIEKKAQQILTSSLTTLSIIFAFITLLLKEKNQLAIFSNDYLFIISLFLTCITITIVYACKQALKTFSLNVYCIIGKNDILLLNKDIKKQLIAKYINYAVTNANIKRKKRDLLKKSYKCFSIVLYLIFLYVLIIFFMLNGFLANLIDFFKSLELFLMIIAIFIVCIAFIAICIYKKMAQNKSQKQKLDNYEKKEKIQKLAYFNSKNYQNNSTLENWLWAEEQIQLITLIEDKI